MACKRPHQDLCIFLFGMLLCCILGPFCILSDSPGSLLGVSKQLTGCFDCMGALFVHDLCLHFNLQATPLYCLALAYLPGEGKVCKLFQGVDKQPRMKDWLPSLQMEHHQQANKDSFKQS